MILSLFNKIAVNRHLRYTITIAILGFFAIALLLSLSQDNASPPPSTKFVTITGKEILLEELSGMPAIVTFWATTCASCIEEIPHLKELYRDLSGQGLNILAVAMFYDPPNRVLEMTKTLNLPYPVVLDPLAKISRAFGDVKFTPTTFLITPNGHIAKTIVGMLDVESIRSAIKDML